MSIGKAYREARSVATTLRAAVRRMISPERRMISPDGPRTLPVTTTDHSLASVDGSVDHDRSESGLVESGFTTAQFEFLLSRAGNAPGVGPVNFVTIGSGPVMESEVNHALVARQRSPYDVGYPVGALLVGRHGWSTSDLDEVVSSHAGGELRAYSQEMLLSLLLTRIDPYDLERSELEAVFGDHPALRYLAENKGFDWPRLLVPEQANAEVESQNGLELPSTGILGVFAYRVGISGDSRAERRRALERAFTGEPPSGAPRAVVDTIGPARSCRRLQQLAKAIARAYWRASRRRDADMSQAMAHWKADLQWLRRRYHADCAASRDTGPGFRWPELPVRHGS